MATTKSTTPRKRSTSRTTATRKTTTTKSRASTAKADDSIVARTGRTLKERPYTSAAIATGAVTAVAAVAAVAAGAFLFSRRDKSFKEASDELTARVKGGFAGASEKIKDLSQRGSDYLKGNSSGETRSQAEIAEEALTLKETGTAKRPIDEVSAVEIKSGAVAY